MLPIHHWAHNFTVQPDDIDYLINLLLEKETPLSQDQLALEVLEHRLQEEREAFEARFRDAAVYNPSETYEVGQRLVFPVMDFSTAVVTDVRAGDNAEYGDFSVVRVEFEDETEPQEREFAAALSVPHKLSDAEGNGDGGVVGVDTLSPADIMDAVGDEITTAVDDALRQNESLVSLAGRWFPLELIMEIDEGHLNLSEAVLDINGGGPMRTGEIIEQIGGLGNAPMSLQVFSLNYALNEDKRFDEVGPTGEVLWYLSRMEPDETHTPPPLLRYKEIPVDRGMLTEEMRQLEREIADELSPLDPKRDVDRGTATLIYPHRRAGTLPLNINNLNIFPSAERTERIYITLVDSQDDEEFVGWVVPALDYVYGLLPLYAKYTLPIGAYATARKHEDPSKIIIDFDVYRARTEWVRLIVPNENRLQFENTKRSIGADYDDLMILGIDDLESLDAFNRSNSVQRMSLAALMRSIIPSLGRLTPQGTAHVKTIYSAVNVVRRCPPGPIMATLSANPDFENVGGHYWRIAE